VCVCVLPEEHVLHKGSSVRCATRERERERERRESEGEHERKLARQRKDVQLPLLEECLLHEGSTVRCLASERERERERERASESKRGGKRERGMKKACKKADV